MQNLENFRALIVTDENDESVKNELDKSIQAKMHLKGGAKEFFQAKTAGPRVGENVVVGICPEDMDISGELNMEASVSADDFMRAGGFGARDDISSFLPVASDSTDFEASLRDAREYEDPQEKICRPGLGWSEVRK